MGLNEHQLPTDDDLNKLLEVSAYPTTHLSWVRVTLQQLAELAKSRRLIVTLDEFSYAVEVEPALPSGLKNVWDHSLKQTKVMLVLCGSHIGMMKKLQAHQAPLFGRITGQLPLGPLPFSAVRAFLPAYELSQRVAVYAILGGVPGYLERFNLKLSLADNVRRHLFRLLTFSLNRPAGVSSLPHTYFAIFMVCSLSKMRPASGKSTDGSGIPS
jgi:AAA+ ATPase superfamily predicted ATPase